MGGPLLDAARAALAERLGPEALAHSEAVARAATELASAYGVDVEEATLAGLLHDWDRESSGAELKSRAFSAGIAITQIDESVPYLLHARTGAAAIRARFPGISDEVVSAVSSHTLGSSAMSDLDRVVYVADMISDDREYAGVDEIRAAVGRVSLEELYLRCYEHTLVFLARSRRPLHPETVAAWNALVAGGRR